MVKPALIQGADGIVAPTEARGGGRQPAALENAKNADAIIAAEEARVEDARRTACAKIDALKEEISACINALDRIKAANLPTKPAAGAFDYERVEKKESTEMDAVADEISATLQALVGSADNAAPTAEPKHPTTDSTTGKFSNLQFGRNYDPTKR